VRFSGAARLGLIALAFVVAFAIAAYFIGRQVKGPGGYQIGVHFPTAAGIAPGAQVFFNGVVIGSVGRVDILPDTTVDVIINISRDRNIPKDARFGVRPTLTGTPDVVITAPPRTLSQSDILPKRILPVAEQPAGTPPLTLEMMMANSRALGDRAQRILAMGKPYGKTLLAKVRGARENGAATTAQLRATSPALMGTVQSTVSQAKENVTRAEAAVRSRNQAKITAMTASLRDVLAQTQRASASMRALRGDPRVAASIEGARADLRTATANLHELTQDLAVLAKNPQTKAELQDAARRFHDILHHI